MTFTEIQEDLYRLAKKMEGADEKHYDEIKEQVTEDFFQEVHAQIMASSLGEDGAGVSVCVFKNGETDEEPRVEFLFNGLIDDLLEIATDSYTQKELEAIENVLRGSADKIAAIKSHAPEEL